MHDDPPIDVAEFVSDYVRMLHDNGEPLPPRNELAQEIVHMLHDYGTATTVDQVEYYL